MPKIVLSKSLKNIVWTKTAFHLSPS